MSTLESGADALEHLTVSAEFDRVTGAYFDGKKAGIPNGQANDPAARRRLRELSDSLIKTDQERKNR
jgi:uncharacterized protein YjlB